MKPNLLSLLSVVAATSIFPVGGWAQAGTPQTREEVLRKAERLKAVSPHQFQGSFEGMPNPFHPVQPETEPAREDVNLAKAASVEKAAPRHTLRDISANVRPTGSMEMGGRTLLLFGERLVGAGDLIPVQFAGQNYQVEVVSIENRAFTLRLNQEVISKRIQ